MRLKSCMAVFFILSATQLTTVPAWSQSKSPSGTDVNVSNLAGHEAEASIDVNPTNPMNLVIAAHAPITAGIGPPIIPKIDTYYTMDGGLTWTRVALGDAQDNRTSTLRFDPTVVFDADGNVYVGYGAAETSPDQVAVIVAKSTNGGQTYSQFTVVDINQGVGTKPGNDKWHLATGPDPFAPGQENIYITWIQLVQEIPFVDQRVVVSHSTNGGATFSNPVIINDASIAGISPDNGFPDPAVGPNGEVYVAWHQADGSLVLVDVSFSGGVTFGTDHVVTTSGTGSSTPIPAAPTRGVFVGPTIDTDRSGGLFNGRLYVTYTDLGAGGLPNTDILVRHSDSHGINWSAPVLVNDDFTMRSQFLPWLDVDQLSGSVSVVWYDARNDPANKLVEVFMSTSSSGGALFSPNAKVSDGQSDQSANNPDASVQNYLEYIGLAAHGCRAVVVWADNSLDPANMDYFSDRMPLPHMPLGMVCPPNITVECSQTGGSPVTDPAIVGFLLAPIVTGGCGPTTFAHNAPGFFPVGVTGVTFTATDNAGGSVSCTRDVTVVDTTPPILSCPTDFLVEVTEACGVPANNPQLQPFFGTVSGFDICDNNINITHDAPVCFPLGKTTVTFCAADDAGNEGCCEADVTVVTASPIPAALQRFGSHWTGDHVSVTWSLIDVEGELSFEISRRTESNDPFAVLHGARVDGQRGEFHFEDTFTEHGMTYEYHVVILEDGSVAAAFVTTIATPRALLALEQNHPNPFNPTTQISYSIDREARVYVAVYDIAGRRVATLVDRHLSVGRHSVQWNGRDERGRAVASGVYFYRLIVGERTLTRKALLLK